MIWSSLVDDPSSHPELFPTEEDQNRERQRLFKILEDLVVWENSNNEAVLNLAKAEGRRIIAVGTTSVRTLESVWNRFGRFEECSGETTLFIYPGYEWHTVDCILTNFHLPKSTLLMIISSFAGKELTERAYREAVHERYRFFSFGDCMFITNE